jgi:hypothetical protein
MFYVFFHPFHLLAKKLGKGLNPEPLGWRENFNHYIIFKEKILCKKYFYNVNYCVGIVQFFFLIFSCGALYYKCINSVPHLTYYYYLMFANELGP